MERIGFIGLGTMGRPMAQRILSAGFPLSVWNRTPEKARELVDQGAELASSPADLAARSDVIVSMVADGPALQAITFGEGGLLSGIKQDSIFVDMSTVDPESSFHVSSAVEAKGGKMLRAPVSGSTVLASSGSLTILVSGERKAFERSLPVLKTMGQKIFHVGEGEEARYFKLLLNTMVATTCQVLAEALVFGKRAGLDWRKMLEVISNSVVGSPLINYKAAPIADRNFKPAFTAAMMAKDLDLALKVATELGVPMPTVALVRQFLSMMRATGRSDLDFSGLILLLEELSGIEDPYTS